MKFYSICIIGLGYIGLPTAAVFAKHGMNIKGVDINQYTVDTINQGGIHIEEPGLEELVKDAVDKNLLKAYTTPQKADAFIMAVPTPFKDEDHEPNLDYIEAATRALAKVLEKGNLVILESTSPVGTTEKMSAWLAEERPDLSFPDTAGEASDIRIAHCPERVLPGQAMRELIENNRIIGGMTPRCTEEATKLYKIFLEGDCVATNTRTAEMCKLTENAFRDVNIAFANELSLICDKQGMDVWELINLANLHPRVNVLQPGPGVGGHCIAVDPWFIVSQSPEQAKIIRTAREVNDGKPAWVVEKVMRAHKRSVARGKKAEDIKVAVFGVAFKPDIDDLRESPALQIAETLLKELDSQFLIVEPNIEELPASLAGAKLVDASYAKEAADISVMLVAHKEFAGMSSSTDCEHICVVKV